MMGIFRETGIRLEILNGICVIMCDRIKESGKGGLYGNTTESGVLGHACPEPTSRPTDKILYDDCTIAWSESGFGHAMG
jgi:hypothetical protein